MADGKLGEDRAPPDRFASAVASRLRANRWPLTATAGVLTLACLIEPQLTLLAAIGFAAIVAITAGPPAKDSTSPRRGAAGGRRREGSVDDSHRAICEALEFPAYVVDRAGILRHANAAGTAAFGPATVGDPLAFKFRAPEIVQFINRGIGSAGHHSIEFHQQAPSEGWYLAQIAPVPSFRPSPSGRAPQLFLLTFFDQSDAKRTEQMRSDFIANASHELRTPLSSLRGYVETLSGAARDDDKARNKFLAIMLEQAERMSRLIDDLLSLSRIEMKSRVDPHHRADLVAVLAHVQQALQPLAAKQGLVIEMEGVTGSCPVIGEHDELIQLFDNLIENACKYGQSGEKIRVELVPRGDGDKPAGPLVRVTDYGPGIPAEHLPRLTERFYRADVESSRAQKGTGLGLAIVKHIVQRHQARMNIRSQTGKGTTITVRFPAV